MWVNGYYEPDGLGFLPAGAVAGSAAGGPVGIAIAAGISAVTVIISIFRAHKAKVQREDQISGAWASSGPQAIQEVMAGWKACQISGGDAVRALKEIENQFRQLAAPIAKYKGKWGMFPDPNGPRPPRDCNWACGTSWDLHRQIQELIAEIQSVDPCETARQRAIRKCANNPQKPACQPGGELYRQIRGEQLGAGGGTGFGSWLPLAAIAVGAILLTSK